MAGFGGFSLHSGSRSLVVCLGFGFRVGSACRSFKSLGLVCSSIRLYLSRFRCLTLGILGCKRSGDDP